MARIPFENADLDRIYSKMLFPLGAETEDGNGYEYVFVKYNQGDGAVDGVAGYLVVGLDSAYPEFEVTADPNSATIPALPQNAKGFLQAALTHAKFGWAQKKGRNRQTMTTDSGVSQGELLMAHATTNGAVDTGTGDVKWVGTALETDTGSSLTAGQAYIDI